VLRYNRRCSIPKCLTHCTGPGTLRSVPLSQWRADLSCAPLPSLLHLHSRKQTSFLHLVLLLASQPKLTNSAASREMGSTLVCLAWGRDEHCWSRLSCAAYNYLDNSYECSWLVFIQLSSQIKNCLYMCMLNCVCTLIASSSTDKNDDDCKTSMRYGTSVFWAIHLHENLWSISITPVHEAGIKWIRWTICIPTILQQ